MPLICRTLRTTRDGHLTTGLTPAGSHSFVPTMSRAGDQQGREIGEREERQLVSGDTGGCAPTAPRRRQPHPGCKAASWRARPGPLAAQVVRRVGEHQARAVDSEHRVRRRTISRIASSTPISPNRSLPSSTSACRTSSREISITPTSRLMAKVDSRRRGAHPAAVTCVLVSAGVHRVWTPAPQPPRLPPACRRRAGLTPLIYDLITKEKYSYRKFSFVIMCHYISLSWMHKRR
jgi:hypothetical protein